MSLQGIISGEMGFRLPAHKSLTVPQEEITGLTCSYSSETTSMALNYRKCEKLTVYLVNEFGIVTL